MFFLKKLTFTVKSTTSIRSIKKLEIIQEFNFQKNTKKTLD
ncbi:hypothetical protein HNR74_004650 [Flammeovirga kamogawensis]|nr:hypothetical protein [Flammeovirga kamogawensis]